MAFDGFRYKELTFDSPRRAPGAASDWISVVEMDREGRAAVTLTSTETALVELGTGEPGGIETVQHCGKIILQGTVPANAWITLKGTRRLWMRVTHMQPTTIQVGYAQP